MGQLPLLAPPIDKRQRNRHFARREKVLGQFFTSPVLAAWMVEIATSMLTNFQAALDPACGDGVFLRQMLQYGFETVVGIDVDAAILKVCAQQLNDEKLNALVTCLERNLKGETVEIDFIAAS